MAVLDIDLELTKAPPGLTVEIDGHEPFVVNLPDVSVLAAIGHTMVCKTGKTFRKLRTGLLQHIRVLDLDMEKKYIKVAVEPNG